MGTTAAARMYAGMTHESGAYAAPRSGRVALRTAGLGMLLAVVVGVAGCGITRGTQVVVSEGDAKQSYHTIAVVPMDGTPEEGTVFATALARDLAARGVQVKDDNFVRAVLTANGSAVIKALKASGADAALYIWLLRADKSGNGDTSVGDWGWTGRAATWYTAPGNTNAAVGRFEARLYDLTTGEEVWHGRTMTFYPKTAAVDAPQVAQAVVGELAQHGFLGAKP
jgi:hypothetical protein